MVPFNPLSAGFWLTILAFAAGVALFRHALASARRADRLGRTLSQARVRLAAAEARVAEQEGVVSRLETALDDARGEAAGLNSERAALLARLEERERAVAESAERMETEFRASAARMLDAAQNTFLARAGETFARHREAADAEGERRRKSMDELIRPMSDMLTRYERELADMRAEQQKARGELAGRIGDLARSANEVRAEAQKLSTALRGGPKTGGRWGEEQLRNVVETAGMSAHVDFAEQVSVDGAEARKTPDMIVNLPGGRKIAVDAKVSIGAYLEAAEASDEAQRASLLARHADDLWAHVKTLAARDYAASVRQSLDVVVMFVPGENYFAAAAEARPQLFQDAFDRKILIATPVTLVAILKAASFNWRQEKAVRHAAEVAAMAKGLYDSLRTMGGHMNELGRSLDRAVGKYNATAASLERRVMVRARKFAAYELPGLEADLAETPLIETSSAAASRPDDQDGDQSGDDRDGDDQNAA